MPTHAHAQTEHELPAGDSSQAHQPARHEHAHDPREMIVRMRGPWLWTNFTVIAMGFWLITSPFTFGYASRAMIWSDLISGALMVIFGAISLWPHPRADFWGRWTVCFVGVWLQFAPLVFWAPMAVAFANNTLIGAFAIALTILVPMMPGMAHHHVMTKPGPEIPPGWTYNPSSWPQRAPIIACGFLGWFISRYLASVQLGYIDAAWEPFFGEGTRRVLHSDVSRSMPISDAGLGALAYTIEALMGFMGLTHRWRTMPWMVTFFGIIVIPLGIVHVILVTLQPVVVGYWCTLCLAAAVVMLIMIPLTVDEVVAMVQFMARAKREGKPLWRTFWVGDTVEGGGPDSRTPKYGAPPTRLAWAMVWGVSLPWNLVLATALGVWLMASPAVFGTTETLADSDHLTGALIITLTVTALAEVTRQVRFANILLGLWLLVAAFALDGGTTAARVNDAIVALALIALSLPRGPIRESYGSWDRWIV